jgi:hypothetical protein
MPFESIRRLRGPSRATPAGQCARARSVGEAQDRPAEQVEFAVWPPDAIPRPWTHRMVTPRPGSAAATAGVLFASAESRHAYSRSGARARCQCPCHAPIAGDCQTTGKLGLSIGYPTSIGLVWHPSARVGIRPEVALDFSPLRGDFHFHIRTFTDLERCQVGRHRNQRIVPRAPRRELVSMISVHGTFTTE